MRKRLIYAIAVVIVIALVIISALPIVRPRYFAWTRGESFFELSIQGVLPPHGGQRGIHVERFSLGPDLRFRVLTIDFAFVAWEFVITEHMPVATPNHAMQRTARQRDMCAFRVCHPPAARGDSFTGLAVADLVSR